MTEKERALAKIEVELKKDIDYAIGLAKACGLLEFLYFIYQLHWVRLLHLFPNTEEVKKDFLNAYTNTLEESIKYSISLVAKFGYWGFAFKKDGKAPILNLQLAQLFLKHGNYINSKYETESLVKLFDVQVSGERDQHFRIDTTVSDADPEVKSLFDYFLRIDYDTDLKKNSKTNKDQLIAKFKDEYLPFSDLFEKELGITVEEFCWLNEGLLKMVTDRASSKEALYEKLPNGNIDVTSQKTFLHFSTAFLYNRSKVYESFDAKFHPILDKLIFKPEAFDEKQLRFHHVTRQPIFAHKDILVISPELILDSLFTNIHYSLIEAESIKDEYIARQASLFLDKVVKIASTYGYQEVEREKDLYEGKTQIGDIDLILRHADGHYLLIEAKNHALPLDIYFKDVAKTREHLNYLQKKWENKVLRRIEHLRLNHTKYSISAGYDYIVVSRYPEIISHYSELFIVSIQEFTIWLESYKTVSEFNKFYSEYSKEIQPNFTAEEMEEMREDNLIVGRFAKE